MVWLKVIGAILAVACVLSLMMFVFWQIIRKISGGVPAQVAMIAALAERGEPVIGRVTQVALREGERPQSTTVSYEYYVDGERYSGTLNGAGYVEYAEGDAIQLMYDPDSPAVVAPASVIEEARAAQQG